MRGGRDYINDLGNVSECNPYGLNRSIASCDLVKNTTLPEQIVEILPDTAKTIYDSIEGSEVTIESRHELKFTAPLMGFRVNKWSGAIVGSGVFSIIGGGGPFDNYIEIKTVANESTSYQISIESTDQKFIAADTRVFEHLVNEIDLPIEITGLNEDTSGSCEYVLGSTCFTTSTYSVNYIYDTGTVLYSWNVVGAPFIDNLDGTMTVTSTANEDVTFTVEVTVSDDLSTDIFSADFTHTRTLSPIVPDQDLLYDATNIATEFI